MTHDILGGYRFCPQTSLSDALSIFVCGISAFYVSHLFLISSGPGNDVILGRTHSQTFETPRAA